VGWLESQAESFRTLYGPAELGGPFRARPGRPLFPFTAFQRHREQSHWLRPSVRRRRLLSILLLRLLLDTKYKSAIKQPVNLESFETLSVTEDLSPTSSSSSGVNTTSTKSRARSGKVRRGSGRVHIQILIDFDRVPEAASSASMLALSSQSGASEKARRPMAMTNM
jgi:hypothetical protein